MRIRSIKPEFWSSPDVAALSDADRLLFIGLWSYVDDHGRGRDDVALIVAALFPHDMVANPRETVAKVRDGLARLSEANLILRYTVASRTYFLVTGWGRHQRVDKPKASRIPEPTEEENGTFPQNDAIRDSVAKVRDDDATPRDTLAPGTGEQGNRGTGDIPPSRSPRDVADHNGTEVAPAALPAPKAAKRSDRATRLPDDWTPSPALIDWTRANAPDVQDSEVDRFRDYWHSAAGAKARKVDWDAVWRNWARRAQDDANARRSRQGYRNQAQIMADMRQQAAESTITMQRASQGDALRLIAGGAS